MYEKDFFGFAKSDYIMLSNCPDIEDVYDTKISLYCQCIEKLMKGFIILEFNEVPDRTHKLQTLSKRLIDIDKFKFLKQYRGLLNTLTNAYFDRRYPGDGYYALDEEEYLELKTESEELIALLRNHIPGDMNFYRIR